MKIKTILKKLIFRIPSKFVVMVHHVSLNPLNKQSSVLLDTNKFCSFIKRYSVRIKSIEDLKNNNILLTFDDGLEDVYTIAYPILKMYGVPFTVFVITDFLNKDGYLSVEQLIEMVNTGLCTVGSHGITHSLLPKLNSKKKNDEIIISKEKLEYLTHKNVDLFAYSHGQYDEETIRLMKPYRYGFVAGGYSWNFVTCSNKYKVPRLNLSEGNYNNVIEFLDRYCLSRNLKK